MRYRLTDAQWAMIGPLLPSRRTKGRSYGADHRLTVEAILWVAYNGCGWRELPERYGKWNTVYRRFRVWAERGVFAALLAAFGSTLDMSTAQIDGSWLRVHQSGTGARKEAAPRSCPESVRQSGVLPGG